jgi:hypothetical protein
MTGVSETLNGRPIIDSGTEVVNGVLLCRFALVADVRENPQPYEAVYDSLDARLPGGAEPLEIGQAVNATVQQAIRFEPVETNPILRRIADERGLPRVGLRDEINLSIFMAEGVGECYEQALLGAVMLRFLQDRRGIGGSVSLERSRPKPMTHHFVRYTREPDYVTIDSSEDYVNVLRLPLFRRAASRALKTPVLR